MGRLGFDGLKRFLSANARRAATLSGAMRELVPFVEAVSSGRYRLAPAAGLDEAAAAKAISLATGRSVDKVIAVSAAKPLPRAAWIDDAAYSKLVALALKERLHGTLGKRLEARYGDDLRADFGLGSGLGGKIAEMVESGLIAAALEAFQRGLTAVVRDQLGLSLAASLRSSLFFFLAFAAAGDAKKVSELVPLVRLLRRHVPIGDLRGEPGTWLVLAA